MSSSSENVTWLSDKVILSLFPGVGLLDRAFETAGFCVVRGPDRLWGGDICQFHPPKGVFWGVIGGSPCQDFSSLRRTPPTGNGIAMLKQFARCVTEARPEWWLLENVARVPDLCDVATIAGYVTQRFDINAGWYCDQSRLRHIQFGSQSGRLLDVTRCQMPTVTQPAALANDNRSFREVCRLQGLPDDFDLPPFLVVEKIRAVGNGVPIPMGLALAEAVIEAYKQGPVTDGRLCKNGCGRSVTGRQKYCGATCRKQAQRRRDRPGTSRSELNEPL